MHSLRVRRLTMDSKGLYQDANVETQRFKEVIKEYERFALAANPGYKAHVDWTHVHSWEEVIEVVDEAAQAHDETSTVWGKVRRVFRSIRSNHEVFAAWTNILPT